jgi:hypothetical protein
LPVFATAATFPMIFISQKSSKISNLPIFTQVKSLEEPYPDVLAIIKKTGQNLPKDAIKGANWLLTDASSANRLQKMAAAGITLGSKSILSEQMYQTSFKVFRSGTHNEV